MYLIAREVISSILFLMLVYHVCKEIAIGIDKFVCGLYNSSDVGQNVM